MFEIQVGVKLSTREGIQKYDFSCIGDRIQENRAVRIFVGSEDPLSRKIMHHRQGIAERSLCSSLR